MTSSVSCEDYDGDEADEEADVECYCDECEDAFCAEEESVQVLAYPAQTSISRGLLRKEDSEQQVQGSCPRYSFNTFFPLWNLSVVFCQNREEVRVDAQDDGGADELNRSNNEGSDAKGCATECHCVAVV